MIEIINMNSFIKENKLDGPITSHQIFFGKSQTYHPQGLYSEEIFGIEGSADRREKLSWIDLNCTIIHPVLYDILQKRIFRKLPLLLSGEIAMNIDENHEMYEDPNGSIRGMSEFVKNIYNIKFKENEIAEDDDETDRNKIINMIYANIKNNTFFIDKLLVISPDYRPVTILEQTNEVNVSEITKLYQKIIMASNQIGGVSGSIYDILSYRMQLLIRDMYELIKIRIAKKSGMIRSLMLGKRVDFSARTVISPNKDLELGYAGVPFRIACQLFEPNILYGLLNSSYANSIPDEFHIAVKEFLAKETLYETGE